MRLVARRRAASSMPDVRNYSTSFLVCLVVGAGLRLGSVFAEEDAQAAPFLVQSWRTADGLPQNSVQAIAQTADGYLWVGTRGGLARFDGVRFTNYGLADGLKGIDIAALLEDGAGGLWIGTFGGGLGHWREGAISTVTTADGLAHDNALVLAPAEAGCVWVGGTGGLQHFGPDGFRRVGEAEGLARGEVTALAADRTQGLWAGTQEHGLFYWKDGRCTPVAGPPEHPTIAPYALLVDSRGALWAGIGNGKVLRRDAGGWTEFNESQGVPYSFIYCLAEGAPGEIWAGSQEQGLFVFREGRFHQVGRAGDALELSIRSLLRSADGLMWAGTHAGGLSRLTPPRLLDHRVEEPGARGQVGGLVERVPGQFLVATYGGGVFQGKLETLAPVGGVPVLAENPFLLTGLKMSDGAVFLGGFNSLLRAEADTGRFSSVKIEQTVTALCEGPEGALWLGTREGELKRLVDGVPQAVPNGAFPGVISGLVRESDSALWVGTRGGGLFRWEAGQRRNWTVADGLPTDVLRGLHRDAAGTLWIGTAGGGLAWMRDGKLQSVNSRRGLGDDFISQILEDDDGHLWLGCNRGIFRVSKRELEDVAAGRAEAVHPFAFDESDGMQIAECTGGYSPAGLRSSAGLLCFSTIRGVVSVDPKNFGAAPAPPPVLIEEVVVDGRRFPARDAALTLPPGPREMEIRYTAFNFSKPEQIRFRHRLDGLDTAWREAGPQRSARFPLLPPGGYTFHLEAANADGRWTESVASLAFTVQPFYWQTAWFRAAMVLLVMASGGAMVWRWTHSRIRQAQAEVEAQQHRNEVARLTRFAALGELSAALAHELNQPLAAILSNAQAAQRFLAQEKSDPAEIRDILQDIVADDERASAVISRLRTLLKKGEFQPEPVDVNEVLRESLRLMHGDLTARAIAVSTDFADGLPPAHGDRVQLQQVLINLMLNAGDAMAQTAADVRTLALRSSRADDGGIQVSLSDRGSGIPPGMEEKIFEPYHTTKPDGLGLGLSLSRSILLAHGGRLWAENRPGGGATFYFTLAEWQGVKI